MLQLYKIIHNEKNHSVIFEIAAITKMAEAKVYASISKPWNLRFRNMKPSEKE